MKDGDPLPVARLLAHTGWMRALARGLVDDEALAEDLVQESLLRAVERPPRHPGALGGWLRTVLSRAASRARVEETGRRRREQAAARPERSDSTPAEVLERVEQHGQVVELVLGLEEPYRSAILLRYFEDWTAEEIARRQGVDATTVRWRLRQAIDLLRGRLDRLHGGRAAWCVALAPFIGVGRGVEGAALPATAGAGAISSFIAAVRWALPGVAIMKVKTIAIAAVLSLLLLLGLLLHLATRSDAGREPASAPLASTIRSEAPASPASPAPAKVPTPPEEKPPATPAPEAPALAVVEGIVLEAESGDPIPGASVRVRGSAARAAAGEDGAYVLRGLPAGEHYLIASAEGHAEDHARAQLTEGGEFLQDFRLERAVDLLVTVKDEEGRPLEGVEVTPAQPNGDYVRGEEYSRRTGAEGKALLHGIGRERRQQVNARKEGYREVWTKDYRIEPDLDLSELTVVMERRPEGDAVVEGRVSGAGGAPLSGIHVQWIHSHGADRGRVVVETARDGSYRLLFPRVGDWCNLSAYGEGFAPSIREGVKPGTASSPARVDFTLQAGHALEGEVLDEEGRPVAGARVLALPTIYHLRNKPLHPGNLREARTDAEGRFSLDGLAGPTTAIRLEGPPGKRWGNNYHPEVEVDRWVTLRLLAWGIIRGRVVDRETGEPVQVFGIQLKKGVGYYQYARTDPGEFFNSPEGSFVLGDLDQGKIELRVAADGYIPRWIRDVSAEAAERAAMHEVQLTRGRFLEGTVVDAASGLPLPGTRVVFGAWEGGDLVWDDGALKKMVDAQEVLTDAAGAFRVREGEPGTLFLRHPGHARLALAPAAWEKLRDASGRLRVALEPATTLSGVLFEDGKPSRRGFLVLYRRSRDAEAGREWLGNLDRDAEGRFRIEDLSAGEHRLEHWRETPEKKTAGLSIQRRLVLESGKELEIQFGADLGPFSFQGRLLAADGRPPRRARLVLRPDFEWSYEEFAASVTAEHEGRFHFLGLRPGRYRVEVSLGDGKSSPLAPLLIESDLEQDLASPSR